MPAERVSMRKIREVLRLTHALGMSRRLVGEATGMEVPWAYVAVASRGLSCFLVKVRGTQMHSSLSDQVPSVNASVQLAKVLTRMAAGFKPTYPANPLVPGGPTVNLGVTLSGGVFFGVYPGHAEFGLDIRTLPGMTLAGLQADLAAFLEEMRREDAFVKKQQARLQR